MLINNFDYLSSSITFYNNGYLSHSSIISGILSILALVSIIILSVYFLLDIIERNHPNIISFNSPKEDAGIYELNTSSLFHFINVVKNIEGKQINEEFILDLLI